MDNDTSMKKVAFFGFPKLAPYICAHKWKFTGMIVAGFVTGILNPVMSLFQSYAIDNFIVKNTLNGFTAFIIAYLLILAITTAVHFVSDYSCTKLEMLLLRDMRRTAFNHLQTLSVGYFNVNGVGVIHARVMSDTSAITEVIVWQLSEAVFNVFYVLTAVITMFILSPLLALCAVAIVPVIALLSLYFHKRLTRINRKVRETNSLIVGGFNEGITGAETTKSLSAEERMDRDFQRKTSDMRRFSVRLGRHRATFFSLITFASAVSLALVLWYGGIISAEGAVAIGTVSVFMTYAQGLMSCVSWSVGAIADVIGVKVNIERFTALTEAESGVKDFPEVVEKYGDSFNPKKENWEKLEGDIEFKDVTFRYPDGGENVLENFNLKVPKGANVAIVGETGAGKSTLVNLVCRFFEPTEGTVLIDGRDARERSLHWLHSNIGYVLQTPHLFSGTVRDNLLFGKEDATDEEMFSALAKVNADKIVARLDGGLDAVIGEGGNNLSMGEKQLISFARAILADPAIFILDEATASVDTLTEKTVQEAIENLMEGRTSFIIAHRLSTVKNADIILVVDGGKIAERGTHTGLLKKKGIYYSMYVQQFREEKVKTVNS